GTLDLGNGGHGILNSGFSGSIGGSTPADANVISGNDGDGLSVSNSNGNQILGNFIGTAANGASALPNTGNGVSFTGGGTVFNALGGTQSADANVIAFNGGDGVQVANAGVANTIRGNSIFSNGSTASDLGIDLGGDGVTADDAKDPDTGPNGLQNFPVITSALVTGSTKTITGTLNAVAGETFAIDFYSSPSCDAAGNGEGQTYLGSVITNPTDADGNVAFTFHPDLTHAPGMTTGKVVTATATSTGAFADTSEFSACFTVADGSAGAGDIQFTSATYAVGEAGGTAAITVARVGGSNGSVTANLSTSNGSAIAPGDYTAISNLPITYIEGETGNKTINITINNDATYESNETVNLSLSATQINSPERETTAPTQAVNPHVAVLTIADNDPQPSFSVDDVTHNEGNSGTTTYVFTVTKTGATEITANVNYNTLDGTATAPSDFTAIGSGSFIFAPTDTTKQITVQVNGDLAVESDETFTVHLASPLNATISDADGTGTILNDDLSPSPTPTATATATATATPTATATATPPATPPPPHALNIATRLRVDTGDKAMIAGFIITGNANKPVVLRGLGPLLANFGISDV
ncbi:MAG TPA: Calx-beta domain-containing protein, partial [Chthoniobacterales bacterium]